MTCPTISCSFPCMTASRPRLKWLLLPPCEAGNNNQDPSRLLNLVRNVTWHYWVQCPDQSWKDKHIISAWLRLVFLCPTCTWSQHLMNYAQLHTPWNHYWAIPRFYYQIWTSIFGAIRSDCTSTDQRQSYFASYWPAREL